MFELFTKTEPNCAIITTLTNVRKHPNADKLQLATVIGEQVVVDLNAKEGDIVIYFDSNLCLSQQFLHNNNLYSNTELNKDTSAKGYFGKNGRVRAQTFRGEKSYGFVCPLYFVNFALYDKIETYTKYYKEGTEFNRVRGIDICQKYVAPLQTKSLSNSQGLKGKKVSLHPKTPMWFKHWDTDKFNKNIDKIPANRLIYIEEKEHGTSWIAFNGQAYKDLNLIEKFLKWLRVDINLLYWMPMHSSRKVMLTFKPNCYNPYYKGTFRDILFDKIKDNIYQNESLYGELVGYTDTGGPIQKGFAYGCSPGEHSAMLYRITINTLQGKQFDMGREYVYSRAVQLGLRPPTLFEKYYYTGNKEELIKKVESYTDGQSAIDSNTLREGVVVWFEDQHGRWACLKNKSFAFLDQESKAKEKEDFVDIEDIS